MRRLTKGYAAALALGAVTLLGACTTPPATDPPSTTSATSASSSRRLHDAAVPTGSQTRRPAFRFPRRQSQYARGSGGFTKLFWSDVNEAFDHERRSLQPWCCRLQELLGDLAVDELSAKESALCREYLHVTAAVIQYARRSHQSSGRQPTAAQRLSMPGAVIKRFRRARESVVQLKFDGHGVCSKCRGSHEVATDSPSLAALRVPCVCLELRPPTGRLRISAALTVHRGQR